MCDRIGDNPPAKRYNHHLTEIRKTFRLYASVLII